MLPTHVGNCFKEFDDAENTGSSANRCIKYRSCKDCKSSKHQQHISIKEELEQHIIESSFKIDSQYKTITAMLPFICDLTTKLSPNKQ